MTEHPLIAYLRARWDEEEQTAWRQHVPLNGAAFALADINSKRTILDWHSGAHECSGPDDNCMWIAEGDACPTTQALAMPYADRDDYPKEQP